jgi:hypothetical protein
MGLCFALGYSYQQLITAHGIIKIGEWAFYKNWIRIAILNSAMSLQSTLLIQQS